MELETDSGVLARWADDPMIAKLVETALESYWSCRSHLKRDREEEEELTCPITQALFEEPVVAADGNTYERAAIQAHFNTGKTTSPLTNERLSSTALTPNRSMKKQVSALRERTQRSGVRKRVRFAASSPLAYGSAGPGPAEARASGESCAGALVAEAQGDERIMAAQVPEQFSAVAAWQRRQRGHPGQPGRQRGHPGREAFVQQPRAGPLPRLRAVLGPGAVRLRLPRAGRN